LRPAAPWAGTRGRRVKVSETVAARILNLIVSDGLQAGAGMPTESVMMEQYGASRGAIREALRILEMHGLITIKTGPTGGPIVSEVTGAEVARIMSLYFARMQVTFGELNNARLELEPLAARSAASHGDRSRTATLLAATRAQSSENSSDSRRYVTACAAFHETVVDMWDNPVLRMLTEAIIEILSERLGSATFTPKSEMPYALLQHQDIAEAISAGRPDDAEAAMRKHVHHTGSRRGDASVLNESINWIVSKNGASSMKAAERVAREILHDVSQADLAPGSRLAPEMTLMVQYGVARPTVREALRLLEVQGLVDIRAGMGGGPSVGEISVTSFARMLTLYLSRWQVPFRYIFEAHIVLDSAVARLVAQRHQTEDRATIEAALGLLTPANHDQPTFIEASRTFHDTLALLCGNPVLSLYARGLNFIVAGLGAVTPPELRGSVVLDAHRAIAEEVLTGDGERASREMRRHLEMVLAFAEADHRAALRSPITWH
jgi:DNA-binding FadR family transcriptional regulator